MGSAEPEPERRSETPAVPIRPGMGLSIPSSERFLELRAGAKENGTLKDLRQMVAAWQAVAEKCNLAFEEMTRLAIYRLEVERDLGVHLAQNVRWGGDRARLPEGTLLRDGGLPEDITKKQCWAYQQLAAVPEDVFRAYLDAAHTRHVVPSAAGARAFAAPPKTPARNSAKNRTAKRAVHGGAAVPAPVIECVERIMTPDVVVGEVAMPAKQRVDVSSPDALQRLHGDVFVAQCPDPERFLVALEQARRNASVRRAVVILPATPWAQWFGRLEHGDWLLCFLRAVRDAEGNGLLLAHIGERPSVFRLAFRSLGVVLRAATTD